MHRNCFDCKHKRSQLVYKWSSACSKSDVQPKRLLQIRSSRGSWAGWKITPTFQGRKPNLRWQTLFVCTVVILHSLVCSTNELTLSDQTVLFPKYSVINCRNRENLSDNLSDNDFVFSFPELPQKQHARDGSRPRESSVGSHQCRNLQRMCHRSLLSTCQTSTVFCCSCDVRSVEIVRSVRVKPTFVTWGNKSRNSEINPRQNRLIISRGSGLILVCPCIRVCPSWVEVDKNLHFTPVPVITDWNHSGCRHP